MKIELPDKKYITQITYSYRTPDSRVIKEFYLSAKNAKLCLDQIYSASIMGWVHGERFKPVKWHKRKI